MYKAQNLKVKRQITFLHIKFYFFPFAIFLILAQFREEEKKLESHVFKNAPAREKSSSLKYCTRRKSLYLTLQAICLANQMQWRWGSLLVSITSYRWFCLVVPFPMKHPSHEKQNSQSFFEIILLRRILFLLSFCDAQHSSQGVAFIFDGFSKLISQMI